MIGSGNCCVRLTGRGQKTYMINMETARIAYKANDSNVKIYLETDSDAQKPSREFDRVSWYIQLQLRTVVHF